MIQMKLTQKTLLTDDIIELNLTTKETFAFKAGQYILLGQEGQDEADFKPFSIANAPHQSSDLTLQIKKTNDDQWMKSIFNLEVGTPLQVSGPKDQYPLPESLDLNTEAPLIFIAGGTGFSPMFALLNHTLTFASTSISFYWGAKKPTELYYQQQMQTLASQNKHLTYTPVLSEPFEGWQGKTGWVHHTAVADFESLSEPQKQQTHVYLCGPWAMREAAQKDFIEAGLPKSHFH